MSISKLFLDDERFPTGDGWVILRTVEEAIAWVEANGFPSYVSFDHDLGNEAKGYTFAVYLMERDLDLGDMPDDFAYYVHSQNPVGAENIQGYIDSHLANKADELAGGNPWPPMRPKNPWA